VICSLLEKCIDFDIYPDVIAKVDGHPDRVTRTHIAKTLVEKILSVAHNKHLTVFLKKEKGICEI
jgi:hypothetical protein